MEKVVTIWWLKTHDNIDVYGDGKGHYDLEALPSFSAVEYVEGERPENDMDTLREEISNLLGVDCHWVPRSGHLAIAGRATE